MAATVKKDNRCIYCGKAVEGLPVRDDYVINAIRLFKRHVTHTEKGYKLVVCKSCFPRYIKAQRSYQGRQGRLIGLGVVFAVVIIALSPGLVSILYGLVVVIFTYLVSLLGYVPSVSVHEK